MGILFSRSSLSHFSELSRFHEPLWLFYQSSRLISRQCFQIEWLKRFSELSRFQAEREKLLAINPTTWPTFNTEEHRVDTEWVWRFSELSRFQAEREKLLAINPTTWPTLTFISLCKGEDVPKLLFVIKKSFSSWVRPFSELSRFQVSKIVGQFVYPRNSLYSHVIH